MKTDNKIFIPASLTSEALQLLMLNQGGITEAKPYPLTNDNIDILQTQNCSTLN